MCTRGKRQERGLRVKCVLRCCVAVSFPSSEPLGNVSVLCVQTASFGSPSADALPGAATIEHLLFYLRQTQNQRFSFSALQPLESTYMSSTLSIESMEPVKVEVKGIVLPKDKLLTPQQVLDGHDEFKLLGARLMHRRQGSETRLLALLLSMAWMVAARLVEPSRRSKTRHGRSEKGVLHGIGCV